MRHPTTGRLAALLLALCAPATSAHAQAECKRPVSKQFRDGETIVIAQPKAFPCKVLLVDTPIELRADEAGVVANIGTFVLRMSDGRFFTSTGRGEVTVWGTDGKFVKNIGRQGQGPGEFATSGMSLHEGPKGTLYVRDNNMRWSMFSPALEFVRHHTAVGMGFDVKQSAFLDDGRFLSGHQPGGRAASFFAVFDFEQTAIPGDTPTGRATAPAGPGPAQVASFGTVEPDLQRGASYGRQISYAGGSTFWAGPPARVGHGYALELWTTNGKLLRTIRREAPWFPKGADMQPPPAAEGTGIPARPVTGITMIHADGTGLVYVLIAAASDQWKPIPRNDPASRANEEKAYDLYFEVIDVDAGAVLVSRGPMTRPEALAAIPPQMFKGSRQGYRISETPEGLPIRRIVDVRLIAQ